ncbi:uncharacterized protein LOC109823946 isoform X2 [Asparagus officinalis]|uniref:uncharacterized protein LOC109823946 isoform X2 n=1 Tax=Asparagus officinalis TaxID=4686 RepID=UPI00098DF551|nr:uncharacterized protein LOC109823946 isoform X2 [Asparagus officinalis]
MGIATTASRTALFSCSSKLFFLKSPYSSSSLSLRSFSSATPYPLYYELINHRPVGKNPTPRHRRQCLPEPVPEPEPKLPMDRSKRKYYRKRARFMFGGDSDSDSGSGSHNNGEFVELKPEVVDFPRLHAREQELYFHDAFAFPWEKDKHYRMVYQLEKKYFPDQSLDKAFTHPDFQQVETKKTTKKNKENERDERSLVFFDDLEKEKEEEAGDKERGVSERKVQEFFRCLNKFPSEEKGAKGRRRDFLVAEVDSEPFLISKRTEFPPRWDGLYGTVVLVDKPKGWTSFTVCGKLRRLVKVQKVGHAGTLDPMATGLLIVCVGKATKLVERYQGMIKGYSGIFRLGEATSTWDADSPVIQREPWEHIKDDDIKRVATSFIGEIWQVPPMFSAIKVNGEKMYDKARRGETVELSPRRISIYQFDIERSLDDRYICQISLCRLGKGSWKLCSFDSIAERLNWGIFSR